MVWNVAIQIGKIMGKIYLSVGISGSGKSRLAKLVCNNEIIELNADEYRKKICGDINNQSFNKLVFQDIDRDMAKYLAGGYSVFLSNTNLHSSSIKEIAKNFSFNDVDVFIMKDSNDLELCWSRIQKDIEEGKERSNVPREILEKQYENFISFDIKSLLEIDNVSVYEVNSNLFFNRVN